MRGLIPRAQADVRQVCERVSLVCPGKVEKAQNGSTIPSAGPSRRLGRLVGRRGRLDRKWVVLGLRYKTIWEKVLITGNMLCRKKRHCLF